MVLLRGTFRSQDIPAQGRFDRSRELTTKTFTPTDTTSNCTDGFEATLHALELGAPHLAVMTFRSLQVLRTPQLIRRSDPDLYQLALPLRGSYRLIHAGRDTTLGAGELVLYDSSRPFSAVVTPPQGCAQLIQVQFPKALLPLAAESVGRLIGRPLSHREGIGALLAGFLARLVRDVDHYHPADTARLGSIFLDLLTALLAHELKDQASIPSESQRHSLMLRIQSFIERHLGDARLSSQTVADAHQISTRYLYKLFQEEGLTVAAWIRERRLESCRRDLADPALAGRPVHAIAARWGFADSAHFSRVFRAAYGMPPKEYRHLTRLDADVREPSITVQEQSKTY
ncbi:helix-turn-helix domain-containing protein [Streptomyces sp. CB01580]|uniref:AraC-like ligand-binding domain-containing protein n=1 Tax=Streptomyces sp. CB01580 TaxID=1703933 RepID=UPI000959B7B9|nr:helix-turn-helix domain-containing protein [Streptomyces sp. CB01580]OKJ27838.1 hypothetical protein AMK22_30005 [Streptomyces sp. CB01580]